MDVYRLYRLLRDDENPSKNGISAKAPNAGKDLESHVAKGSWNWRSQYISCTSSLEMAVNFASKRYKNGRYRIAFLDRDRIESDESIELIDMSDGGDFENDSARNFARYFKEVVVVGKIPKEYVLCVNSYD
ncbi:hypothetical protein MAR_029608 [Mya arenaria]|uniref:DUF7587 domain-containing protein n=1 Tax=Mya arenaria TaxID=6604 RepID=A0ABY7DI50_MYAAR|nr:hypothetical protein MAR_029608 [Mya arenaria]